VSNLMATLLSTLRDSDGTADRGEGAP